MPSMTYCRHENAAREMDQAWEMWDDYEPGSNDYEDRGRRRIVKLVREMHEQFEDDGTYDEGAGLMTTIVYGASDDLIEVDGPVSEEFGYLDSDPAYLAFSNGVVLKVTYDDEGIWRIHPRANADRVRIDFAIGEDADRREDGSPGYSDRATIDGDIDWVVFGTGFEAAR